MKLHALILPLSAIVLIATSSLVTYHAFSYSRPAVLGTNAPDNPLTLILPDQEYVITTRDLSALERELVIPRIGYVSPSVSYDAKEGTLNVVTSPKDYVISVADLTSTMDRYVDAYPAKITPPYTLRDRYVGSIEEYNHRLNLIHRTSLNISLKDGSELTDIALNPTLLRSILIPTSTQLNIPPLVNQTILLKYLTDHLTPEQKQFFSPTFAYENTQKAVNARFMGEATPQVLGVDDGPTSYGERADKYLEVDLSQQKMYFFIKGKLFKEYRVSTGAEYPTPVGDFHILNKAPNAFSAIYNVWMPYWMGFKYASDVGAYLGLHEIAYALDDKGKPVYNHGYYIGDMMTGGCVAMEPKDSREIYNLSDVGMLVRVVK